MVIAKDKKTDLLNASDKHAHVLIAVIAIISVLVGPVSQPIVDSALYADMAKNLLKTGSFEANFTPNAQNPFFPMVLSIFMLVFGEWWSKAFIAFVIICLGLVTWFFAKQMLGEKNAIIALAVLVATPMIFYVSLDLLSDALFLVLAIAASLQYLKISQTSPSLKQIALLSVLTTLAILTRNTGFLIIVIFSVHQTFLFFTKQKTITSLKTIGVFLLFLGIFLFPWVYYSLQLGSSDIGGSYLNKISQANRYGEIGFFIKDYKENGSEKIELNPAISSSTRVPLPIAYFIRIGFYLLLFGGLVFTLVSLAGIVLALMKDLGENELFLLAWLVVFLAFHTFWPLALSTRYIAPLLIPLAVFFTQGVKEVSKNSKKIALAIIALQLVFSMAVIYWDINTRWDASRAAADVFEQSGEWLKQNTNVDEKILVVGMPTVAVSFYSDRQGLTDENASYNYIVASNYFKDNYTESVNYGICAEYSNQRFYAKIFGKSCGG